MTLNCASLTQSSVTRIIHRNIGLKCFFFIYINFCYYRQFLLTFIFHKVVQRHIYCVVGYIINPLLQTACKVCQSKNIENWSIIGENIDRSKVPRFFMAHSVQCSKMRLRPGLCSGPYQWSLQSSPNYLADCKGAASRQGGGMKGMGRSRKRGKRWEGEVDTYAQLEQVDICLMLAEQGCQFIAENFLKICGTF